MPTRPELPATISVHDPPFCWFKAQLLSVATFLIIFHLSFFAPLYTSSLYIESLKRVEELTGKKVEFVELDLLDEPGLKKLFADHDFGAVIHFAGLKVCFG